MKQAALWTCAIVVAAALLVATDYHSRDPDSALYARLSGELAQQPPSHWIAPQWGGAWNQEGLFREHPVGILLPAVALIRAGFPHDQASYAVNMLYQAAVIVLIPLVAGCVATGVEAGTLAWVLQLLPVAFAYRIRANQEHPVLMCVLAMLYACQRARTRPAWILLMVAAFCFMVLIKGAFAMFGIVAVVLWLLVVPAEHGSSDRWPWIGLAAALAAAAMMMAGYEAYYHRITGESFFAFYNSTRLGGSMDLSDPRVVPHAIANVGWYLLRLAWFAAPWSLCAFAATWFWARARASGHLLLGLDAQSERVLMWAWLLTAAYIAVLSPASVRAERFIFPTYFVMGSIGVIAAMRYSDGLRRFAERAATSSWLPIAVWLGTFLLSLGSRVVRF